MKIFVTGMTGFIGSKLGKFFSGSDEIYALARTPIKAGLDDLKVEYVLGDLNDPADLISQLKTIRPEVCIHLAWEGIPDLGFDMTQKNLNQGISLFRALVEECGCRKIVAVGSDKEYGKTFGACQEDDVRLTNTFFAWGKSALCDFGMMLAQKNQISFIWTRIFYVYGPGQRRASLVPTLASAFYKGESPVVKTPKNANDFIFVDDVAEALVLAVHKEVPTGIYNLGTGRATPVWKICEVLEKALGRDGRLAQEMGSSSLKPTADFWADTSKTASALGWKARTSMADGIKNYLEILETA